jgi:hypothetical protein
MRAIQMLFLDANLALLLRIFFFFFKKKIVKTHLVRGRAANDNTLRVRFGSNSKFP